jgi:hypothetical protein
MSVGASETRTLPVRRRWLRFVVFGVGFGVLLMAVLVAVASRGRVDRYPRAKLVTQLEQSAAPRWTLPCWTVARWSGYSTCLRVTGRVVWRQKHDSDGDGDRHLLVVSRLHVHLVKLAKDFAAVPLPRVGERVDAVGWMGRGSHGRTELATIRFAAGGRVMYGRPSG